MPQDLLATSGTVTGIGPAWTTNTFSFSSSAELTSGNTYWVVVRVVPNAGDERLVVAVTGDGAYGMSHPTKTQAAGTNTWGAWLFGMQYHGIVHRLKD